MKQPERDVLIEVFLGIALGCSILAATAAFAAIISAVLL